MDDDRSLPGVPGVCYARLTMRVLCSPDSFKGSLSATEAAKAMAEGVEAAGHDAVRCPIADGGEGTLDLLLTQLGGTRVTVPTFDPLGRTIPADFGVIPDLGLGIVEMAAASGLSHVGPDERRPLRCSSYGTGLLLAVASRQVDRLLLTLGGTATVDGGCGILQALGCRVLTDYGVPLDDPVTGGRLTSLTRVEAVTGLPPMDLAADVMVPLLGPDGAARRFGPQKGADDHDVDLLEAGLMRLADLVDPEGRFRRVPGGGAAGGTAFTLHALLGAEIHSGAERLLDLLDFETHLQDVDLLLVGEGRLDSQSIHGKAPFVAATRARDRTTRIIGICGQRGEGWEALRRDHGGPMDDIISLTDAHPLDRARSEPADCLRSVVTGILSGTEGGGTRS